MVRQSPALSESHWFGVHETKVSPELIRKDGPIERSAGPASPTPRILPGALDSQAEQRQSLLLLVDNFSRQDVELALQSSRTAVNVQHVQEQHKIHRADRTT